MPEPLPERDELLRIADACVQCGLCLPHCPTYADTGIETESPRGRILLTAAMARGRLPPAEADRDGALSHCLGCRACEAACPAHVDYGRLLRLGRQVLRRTMPPPRWQRALEWLLCHPRWLAVLLRTGDRIRPLPGLRSRIPPPPTQPSLPAFQPAQGRSRGRLALFQGCVASHWERDAHHAALRLLSRLRWEVEVLPAACCGALHRHGGAADRAAGLSRHLAADLRQRRLIALVHAGSGCHEALREAAAPLPVHELCAFLVRDPELDRLRFRPADARVGLHVACTQRNVVRAPDAERGLLERIPGLELCAPAPAACCGAAGIEGLRDPQRAARRLTALRDWYRAQAPDVLLAGNLGCRLHLARGLAPSGAMLEAEHPLVFLVRHLA